MEEGPQPPPLDICENGNELFHSNPGFAKFTKCKVSNECTKGERACCLAQYCLCGIPRHDAIAECVPSIDEIEEVDIMTLASTTVEPTISPTNAPTTAEPTNAPTTVEPTNEPTTAAPTTASPTSAPTTASPTNKPTTAAPTPAPGPEDECLRGSPWHILPSFSGLAPCFKAADCGETGCCMKKYCFCSASMSNDCVPFPPEIPGDEEQDAVDIVDDITETESPATDSPETELPATEMPTIEELATAAPEAIEEDLAATLAPAAATDAPDAIEEDLAVTDAPDAMEEDLSATLAPATATDVPDAMEEGLPATLAPATHVPDTSSPTEGETVEIVATSSPTGVHLIEQGRFQH